MNTQVVKERGQALLEYGLIIIASVLVLIVLIFGVVNFTENISINLSNGSVQFIVIESGDSLNGEDNSPIIPIIVSFILASFVVCVLIFLKSNVNIRRK